LRLRRCVLHIASADCELLLCFLSLDRVYASDIPACVLQF
jgi:hypothetical protein